MELLQNLKNKQLILASQSPRRHELLKGIALDFKVFVKKDVDESFDSEIPIENVAQFLAKKKAQNYNDEINDNTILITADTVVCADNKILNKPIDINDAKKMLNTLSGKKHRVITGVCIKSKKKEVSFSSESIVYFDELSNEEINYYIANYKPFDKAGAYGIQEWIGLIGITRIEGSFFNVMGLPVQVLYKKLKEF